MIPNYPQGDYCGSSEKRRELEMEIFLHLGEPNNARRLREFLSTIIETIYPQDLNELRIIRIVADNSIVTKINNILTPSFIRKHWLK